MNTESVSKKQKGNAVLPHVSGSGLLIHKKKISETRTMFYFTKSKRRCLEIEYNSNYDYDKGASGFETTHVQVFYYNSFRVENLTKIEICDVPKPIIDILSYVR